MSEKPRRRLDFILWFFLLLCCIMPARDALTAEVVDRSTMTGKVMCGYQGWFACPDDDLGRGWYHWGRGHEFGPGKATIDLWPDVSELDEEEKCPTSFVHADGSTAHVFSSQHPKTVDRHFKWMREYGIDGAFVQRFGAEVIAGELQYRQFTRVLENARRGANNHGRAYALMYDLSGLRAGQVALLKDDFNRLLEEGVILGGSDAAYLHHRGRPVVSVWGVGFSDDRPYTLAECAELVQFFKTHPAAPGGAGFTVMLGVPTYWRTLKRDTVTDPFLHDILRMADILSPWSVGRYANATGAERLARQVCRADMEWCGENNLDYLPVVFPGFSWHNLQEEHPIDQIPRQGGAFLWAQYRALHGLGAKMVYQAMFDEVDEATAIFKCTNEPPVNGTFLTYEGLPADHYLWLTGMGGKLIRREIEATEALPLRGPETGEK